MSRLLLILAFFLLPTAAAYADPAPPGAIVVDSSADTDAACAPGKPCTLRGAILTANARKGQDTIAFNLLVTRIAPETPLPPITEAVTIDGFTQAGMSTASGPMIELDGVSMALSGAQPPAARGALSEPLERPKAKQAREAADDGVIRFLRPWGLDLRDADGSIIRGLIVHDFPFAQIGLDGADQVTIKGNWLGLGADGDAQTRRSANDLRLGLSLINSAQAQVGGPGREKNVISGNDIGLVATDGGSVANVVLGNYIGTTTDGRGRRPNADTGILLTEPVGHPERGTSDNFIAGNVVVGDGAAYGISVRSASGTQIAGNFVGINAAGEVQSPAGEPLGNDVGILVFNSPKTAVGGLGTAEYNLVSGNHLGIEVTGGSDEATIAGNRIGTDYDGKVALGTGSGAGIVANGAGVAPAGMTITGNTFAGASGYGLYVTGDAKRTTISENSLGTDLEAKKALPNRIGFAVGFAAGEEQAPTDLTFGPGNTVAGNLQDGVQMLGGAGAVVRGNRIGLSRDGKPVGNGTVGVRVEGDGVLVENNTVSANAQGIAVVGDATGTLLHGNRIGTGPDGDGDLGNSGAGVLVGGQTVNTRVGGSEPNAGNLISGNARGVQVYDQALDTTVRGNLIGTDTTGTKALGNDFGVVLQGGRSTVVGGALGIDARNLIVHNTTAGVRINGAAKSTIIGNSITDNLGPGVQADGKGGDAVIGLEKASIDSWDDVNCRDTRCNRIENNRGAGVRVLVPSEITVRGNRFRANTGLDVDLGGPGATANDAADYDDWLNTATGVSVVKPGRLGGELDKSGPQTTIVDVYGFTATDLIGGRPRAGTQIATVQPDRNGEWTADLPKSYAAYAATVTDSHGATSEMSPLCTGDADGDSLCDNWERSGIDYDADGTADLRLQDQGADPAKPDLFVEIDYQAGHRPHLASLYKVKRAFELAPRPVELHTDVDEEVTGDSTIDADGRSRGAYDDVRDFYGGCDTFFGHADDRDGDRCDAILNARRLAYRYALFAGAEKGGNSGSADPGGDAFIVTLGSFPREDILLGGGSGEHGCNRQYDACLAELEAAVFMHELGHTLGLRHGGDKTGENNEPNYLSVMNYWYLARAPLNSRPLDYSRKTPVARDEAAFDEGLPFYDSYPQRGEEPWSEVAISAYDPDRDQCRIYAVGVTESPINLDHDPQATEVAMGLNDPDGASDPQGPEACQDEDNYTVLTGTDDWSRLRFSRFGLAGWREDQYGSEKAAPDLSRLAQVTDTDGDGIDDAHDVCVAAEDADQKDSDGDGLGDACLPFITQRDVELSLQGSANVPEGGTSTLELTLRNTYPKPALGAVVALTPPAGVELDTTRWEAGEIPARGEKTLTVTARGSAVGRGDLTAELVALTDTDWDSTPGNHDAAEDDQAAKRLTVFKPGALGTVSLPARAVREGDEGPHTGFVRIQIADVSGTSVSGRLRSVGGTATAGDDYKAIDEAIELSPFDSETTIPVTVYGDTLDEGDETIELELSGVDGAQPDTARGTFTITDDDAPLEPGQLAWMGCVSRDFGEGTCDQREPLVKAPTGNKALTPDGRYLWIPDDEKLVRLTRNPQTGGLGEAKCWTTSGVERGGCPRLGTTDLDPFDLAVSPDGKTLFMAGSYEIEGRSSPGMGVASFALDANGDPSLASCIACDEYLPLADLTASPDGRFLLTVGHGQRGNHGQLTVYPVLDGKLQPAARCYAHPAEHKPCDPLTVNLDGIAYFDWSGDGKTLALRSKDHLALLGWGDGVLSEGGGCLSDGGRCRPATECTLNGDKEFVCPTAPAYLAGIGPVRFAPDGRALYVAAHKGDRVTAFPRVADKTWAVAGSMCVGRSDTPCAVKAENVDEALELVVPPDGGDVYVAGDGNGITALQADPRTGLLSAPRCSYGGLGVPSCLPQAPSPGAAYSLSRGNLLFDPTGRDLYTVAWLSRSDYGVGRFLRVTRPPGTANRAPLCTDADATARPGETIELMLRCADPDGDPVALKAARGELSGARLRVTVGVQPGVETIAFHASDGSLDSAEAVVRIVVGNPPACQDAHVSVDAGGVVELPFVCDRGTVEVVQHPHYGGLNGATFRATARDGDDTVRYVSFDADTGVRSNTATITVTVRPLPKGPDTVEFGSARLENDRGGSGGCSGSSCSPNPKGELPFPMRCNGNPTTTPGTCSGTLEACSPSGCKSSTGRATAAALKGSLGRAKFSIPVGQARTVKLKLNRAARRELAKRGRLKLKLRTTVTLPGGRTVSSTRKLTVKQPRKR